MLLAVYLLTLAPTVTFWDAGELIAAAHTLGVPHPPGTPLYVLLARALDVVLGPAVGSAAAVNALSALCTAAAGGITAALVTRWTREAAGGVAAALCAGTMATVWLNATEAEVYAASLLLGLAMLLAGERAGRTADPRWSLLLGYLFALAVPLHLSALVAAPAAVLLAASGADARVRWDEAALLAVPLLLALGVGTLSPTLLALAFLALPLAVTVRWRGGRARPLHAALAALVALSAVLVLLVRARLDPPVNQGDPATLEALLWVIGRRQYDLAPLWPRQAPLWLQLGNLIEYADWQVALGLSPTVEPSWRRTPLTLAFVALGVAGSRAHRRADARSWRALVVLLAAASVGVVLYLNLKAGPSFGHGVLPEGAVREARERDYFFALAFWVWGAWAGVGIAWLARGAGWARAAPAGALLPMALNWSAVTRRHEPDASLPRATAAALLASAPPRAVLLLAGDNDTYPLWYLQQVEGVRPDVTPVTVPLLGAPWYRDELAQRHALLDAAGVRRWAGLAPLLRGIAERARAQGRPLAASLALGAGDRAQAGDCWRQRGMVYVAAAAREGGCGGVERAVTDSVARQLAALLARAPRPSVDGTARYMHALLECPALALRAVAPAGGSTGADLLDSRCNRR